MGVGDAEVWLKDDTNTPFGVQRADNKPVVVAEEFLLEVDKGDKTPLGMMSVQTEAITKRQQEDKPFNINVFNDGVRGDSGELEGMPSEENFTESDFNVALRFPSAIRTMWSDEIAIEVMEALLLRRPFEQLQNKLNFIKGKGE